LSSTSDLDPWVVPVYWVAVALFFMLAGIFALAQRSVQQERADSVGAIKTDLDNLLGAYEEPELSADAEREVLNHFLQRMRVEAQDNHGLITRAAESGRYWRMTETGPSTKEWKNNSLMLEDRPELQELHAKGRRAATEVERVLTTRSLRFFSGSKVRSDDRLSDALSALSTFDQALTDAMGRSS
jgi:hypothetical protein